MATNGVVRFSVRSSVWGYALFCCPKRCAAKKNKERTGERMAKLDLSPLDELFARGEDFELTADQYEQKIGKPLPKTVPAIKGGTAPLARKAKENGFTISAVIDRPVIMRTVIFKKV